MKKIRRRRRITRSIVPNLLTLANLFSGFAAIVSIHKGEIVHAALFILLGAIFDALDGVTARLTKSTSELGVELDSLCDAVTFGVAPSFMLYKVFFYQYPQIGVLLSSLPALAGVYRLARFNVQLTGFEDKLYFKGLPIPSGALTIISYIVFFHFGNFLQPDIKYYTIIVLTLLVPAMMASTIKFDNMPRPTKTSFKQRPVVFVIFLTCVIISVITKGMAVFPVMLFYIFASVIRQIILLIKERYEPIDDFDETDISEYSE